MKFKKENKTEIVNSGFGTTASKGIRLFNKNGKPNISIKSDGFFSNKSIYHTIIDLHTFKFIGLTLLSFIVINILFTICYYYISANQINGLQDYSATQKLIHLFFFSVQTFTTVGYGALSPNGISSGIISSIESFTGLLFFALVTGLLYAKFSKPTAFIKFSNHAIIAPFQNGKALMFRIVPYKNTILTNTTVNANVALVIDENGVNKRKFYDLNLEIEKVNSFVLNWTLVHIINEESPLFDIDFSNLENTQIEILVFIKAFDEAYSNQVNARGTYSYHEILNDYKFMPMHHFNEDEQVTVIDINKLSDIEKVALP
jgi:inward rectifier potassium channel